jgi:hypothetical protein
MRNELEASSLLTHTISAKGWTLANIERNKNIVNCFDII